MHNQDTSLIRTLYCTNTIKSVPLSLKLIKPSLDSQALQRECGKSTTHQDSAHYDDQGGCEDELSGFTLSVSDGQGKCNGSSEPGKDEHVLETELDTFGTPEIEEEGEDVDVDDTTSENSNLVGGVKEQHPIHCYIHNGLITAVLRILCYS